MNDKGQLNNGQRCHTADLYEILYISMTLNFQDDIRNPRAFHFMERQKEAGTRRFIDS